MCWGLRVRPQTRGSGHARRCCRSLGRRCSLDIQVAVQVKRGWRITKDLECGETSARSKPMKPQGPCPLLNFARDGEGQQASCPRVSEPRIGSVRLPYGPGKDAIRLFGQHDRPRGREGDAGKDDAALIRRILHGRQSSSVTDQGRLCADARAWRVQATICWALIRPAVRATS